MPETSWSAKNTTLYNTFVRWINYRVGERDLHVLNLEHDLVSGIVLLQLASKLSGKPLKARRVKVLAHAHDNILRLFQFLQEEQMILTQIGAEDIIRGDLNILMRLLWNLVLQYEINPLTQHSTARSYAKRGSVLLDPKTKFRRWYERSDFGRTTPCVDNTLQSHFSAARPWIALLHAFSERTAVAFRDKVDDIGVVNDIIALLESRYGVPALLEPGEVISGDFGDESLMIFLAACATALQERKKLFSTSGLRNSVEVEKAQASRTRSNQELETVFAREFCEKMRKKKEEELRAHAQMEHMAALCDLKQEQIETLRAQLRDRDDEIAHLREQLRQAQAVIARQAQESLPLQGTRSHTSPPGCAAAKEVVNRDREGPSLEEEQRSSAVDDDQQIDVRGEGYEADCGPRIVELERAMDGTVQEEDDDGANAVRTEAASCEGSGEMARSAQEVARKAQEEAAVRKAEEDAEVARKAEEEEAARRAHEEAEAARKAEEEAEAARNAMAERKAEEEAERKSEEEAASKAKEEAEAARNAEEEAAKKAEEEGEVAVRKAEEEAEAARKAEEEVEGARKAEEEEEVAVRKAEEEAEAARKAEEEVERARKAEEEAARKVEEEAARKAEEEEARKAEEEAAREAEGEAEAARKAGEEAEAVRKAEEEEEAARKAEEEEEEEEARKAEEEVEEARKAEEEAEEASKAEEEARKVEEEARKAEEEAEAERKAQEEAEAARKAEEEAEAERKAEVEAASKAEEVEAARKAEQVEAARKAEAEEAAARKAEEEAEAARKAEAEEAAARKAEEEAEEASKAEEEARKVEEEARKAEEEAEAERKAQEEAEAARKAEAEEAARKVEEEAEATRRAGVQVEAASRAYGDAEAETTRGSVCSPAASLSGPESPLSPSSVTAADEGTIDHGDDVGILLQLPQQEAVQSAAVRKEKWRGMDCTPRALGKASAGLSPVEDLWQRSKRLTVEDRRHVRVSTPVTSFIFQKQLELGQFSTNAATLVGMVDEKKEAIRQREIGIAAGSMDDTSECPLGDGDATFEAGVSYDDEPIARERTDESAEEVDHSLPRGVQEGAGGDAGREEKEGKESMKEKGTVKEKRAGKEKKKRKRDKESGKAGEEASTDKTRKKKKKKKKRNKAEEGMNPPGEGEVESGKEKKKKKRRKE